MFNETLEWINNPDLKKTLFCQADYFVSTGIQERFKIFQK